MLDANGRSFAFREQVLMRLVGLCGGVGWKAVSVRICRIFRVLVSHGECAQELADGIETFGQSLRSECSQETSDFGSGLGHLGFRSAVANVSKYFLMCGEHWPQFQKRM